MKLTATELAALVGRLRKNDPTLKEVNLTGQGLSTQQLQEIATALEQNYHLKTLILDQNFIDDIAAQALGKALGVNSNLVRFSAHMCGISDAGATSIADGIKVGGSLQKLELPLNKIHAAGATALAKALVKNKTVLECNLGNCNIGDAGLKQFGLMLDQNVHLEKLVLNSNGLDGKAMKDFEHHVANHPSLVFLDFWGNGMAYVFDEDKYAVEVMSTKFIDSDPIPCLAFLWASKQQKTGAELDTHPVIVGQAKIKVRY